MRFTVILSVLGFALLGCGESTSPSNKMVRTGPVAPQVAADGRLTSAPSPLTLEDLDKLPENSAQRAVMEALFWAQWGNIPAIVGAYRHDIVEALGVSRFTGTYSWLRPQLLRSRMRVISARRRGPEVFVSIEVMSMDGPVSREGFVLRPEDGSWKIVYDTLFERGLSAYTTFTESRNPPNEPADRRAVREGTRLGQLYRDTYVSRTQARRAQLKRTPERRATTQPEQPSPTPAAPNPAG